MNPYVFSFPGLLCISMEWKCKYDACRALLHVYTVKQVVKR